MTPKLNPTERIALIKRVIEGGEPVAKVCREVGISRVLFYRWLARYKQKGASALQPKPRGRPKVAPTVKIPRHPTPKLRLEMLERVIVGGEPVSKIAREYGISRTLFYRLLKRYKEAPEEERLEALEPKKAYIERYFRQTPERFERSVLALVVKHPEFGVRRLVANLPRVAGVPIVGHHGVQNILWRAGLSTYEARAAWAAAQVTPVTRAIGEIVSYLSRFIALPVEVRAQVIRFAGITAISAFLTIVILGIGGFWLTVVSGVPLAARVGFVFASTALLMGSLFFLYSMKYYFTLAIVLSFSQQASPFAEASGDKGNGNGRRPGEASGPEGRRNGILSWLLGFGNGINGGSSLPRAQRGVGLEPSLEHVTLKRKPFVSIHIPFYNEKNVAERILAAVTAFDWANYEVVIADDSTDETTQIIENYLRNHKSQITNHKGEGWTLEQGEVRPGVTLKHLHRTSRSGFKGGALAEALKHTDPRAEFIVVFDADFVPYPDTLDLFLKYFKVQNNMSEDYKKGNVACVQGYQWHVLNKSENWITRGVRAEYAGSYVIERSGTEILGALKMIAGSVYMVRRDLLERFGWGTSITEDFQLTLRLYEAGYKVVYTPYIQAPAECVSTIRRLIRQRMRWAEGHSHNIRLMFLKMLRSPNMGPMEKLEFLYLSPYYLQAFFFLVGTLSWLISETIFPARLPFWTSLWGWSLVLTNLLSLPLMNAVGLFLEESEDRDYLGLISFVALSYILVPFQAYAAIKGFLEKEEGPWFRTPKTGRITDVFTRGRFYRFISGILPGRAPAVVQRIAYSGERLDLNTNLQDAKRSSLNAYLSLATANNRFDSFKIKKKRISWVGKIALTLVLTLSILVNSMAFTAKPVEATWYSDSNYLYRKKLTIDETLVSGSANHSNFPILVSYTDASLKTTANGGRVTNSSGYDIIFTDDDKTTQLAHEIEKYTATTGAIVMWVRIPTLPYNVDKDIYIYYGNSSISTSQENVAGVWDSNYVMVQHLQESPNDGVAGHEDSTSYNNDGTPNNFQDAGGGSTNATGQINGADDFGGDNDYVSVPTSTSLNITGNKITIELWMNLTSTFNSSSTQDQTLIDGGGKIEYWLDAGTGKVSFSLNTGGWLALLSTQASWTGGTPYHLVGVYDGTNRYFYVNGSQDNTGGDTGNLATTSFGIWISQDNVFTNEGPFDGIIDEVRISDINRSADWVSTSYNNQNNQGTGTGKFIKTLGSEEEVPELIVLLLPLAALIPYFVKYTERRKKMYLGIMG